MKNRSAWKILVLAGLFAGLVGIENLSLFNPNAPATNSVGLSNEGAHYLASLLSGQIPPRFDSLENYGFGDLSFTFQYPLKIWIGIPAVLLGFNGNAGRRINLIVTIGLFLWGLWQIDRFNKTKFLSFLNAAWIVLVATLLELVSSNISITLMIMSWLVWATVVFIKKRSAHDNNWWSHVISKEGLQLALVISLELLASPGMVAVCVGFVLGIVVAGTKSAAKPLIICLLWALINSAWFLLPQYAERVGVISDTNTGAYISKTFDAQKARAIFDDYPNQKIISPNAAVKIIPNHKAWRANSFTAIVPEKSLLIEKTMYFAGWSVKANGLPLALENPLDHAGLVAYQLEAGEHLIASQMTQCTWPRMLGNSLSVVGIGIWAWNMRRAVNAKHSGRATLERLFRTLVRSKEKLAKIMKRFLPQRSR